MRFEGALQQGLESVSDKITDAETAQLVQPMLAAGVVHRLGQCRVRVDERAVQIE